MRFFFIMISSLALFTCKEIEESSDAKNLNQYPTTTFVLTLEDTIPKERNAVYASTMLFAWDELRKKINGPLEIKETLGDLYRLNNSTSYIKVLKPEEYKASGEIINGQIIAKAQFKKSLPFKYEMTDLNYALNFNNAQVASFGVIGFNNYYAMESLEIAYYKDDNNFIIKLFPSEKEHEIILFKSEHDFNSMTEILHEIYTCIEKGRIEKKTPNNHWKYSFEEDDELIIPKIYFNIETNYPNLEGKTFIANGIEFPIITAWQHTEFTLNEKGAEVKSEAVVEACEAVELPKPKKLHFNKPFTIFLKRTDAKNPYFGLFIRNSELMSTESNLLQETLREN